MLIFMLENKMSKPKIKFEKIVPRSSRPTDTIVRRKSGDLCGRPIEGFEHLDYFPATYRDEISGLSLLFEFSVGVAPKGAGTTFSMGSVERMGVIVGTQIRYGMPKESSPQQSMRRVGYQIKYGGRDWTPDMIQAADRLVGVPHNKVIPNKVELLKPFHKFVEGIIGPALKFQFGQSEETSIDRDFLQENTKKILRKMGRKYKWESTKEVEIENPDQNTSENPKTRAPKTNGKGSNSRGKKKISVPNYTGKFNVSSQNLGENYPPFTYEMNGEQIVIILNEDCPQTSAILDQHAHSDEAVEASPIFEKTMMRAGQQAVNRENGNITPKQWESYVKIYGSLSSDEELMNVVKLREAI